MRNIFRLICGVLQHLKTLKTLKTATQTVKLFYDNDVSSNTTGRPCLRWGGQGDYLDSGDASVLFLVMHAYILIFR